MCGFFVSGTSSFTQDQVCETLIGIGLICGFSINSIDQTEETMKVGLWINNGEAVNALPADGLDPCFAIGINAK